MRYIHDDYTILTTGGAGFIGSNFIEYFLRKNPSIRIVNLDLLTYAANMNNLDFARDIKHHTFVQGDINDKALVENLFDTYRFNAIINFAAESHVDNSISSPDIFIKTNINGTFNLLDIAYRFWFHDPFNPKTEFVNALFYHISTDEVFGSLDSNGYFSESSPYAPNSPYSASKASSDLLVRSYAHTYGMNAVITNCSNNYGPKQHDEKLIPTIIRNAINGSDIPIYGDGNNIRDWLYVRDHATAINIVLSAMIKKIYGGGGGNASKICKHKGNTSIAPVCGDSKQYHFDTFNIGANGEYRNIQIAKKICAYLDSYMPKRYSYADQIRFVKDRAGHDRRYAIDSAKIKTTLGWKPQEDFDSGIIKTIQWYIRKYKTEHG